VRSGSWPRWKRRLSVCARQAVARRLSVIPTQGRDLGVATDRIWRIRGLLHRRVGVSLWRPDGCGRVVGRNRKIGFDRRHTLRALASREPASFEGVRLAAGCADAAGAFAADATDYGRIARITSFAARMMVGGVARQRPPVNPWPGLEPDKPAGSPAWRGGQASGVSMPLQRFWMVSQEQGRTPRKHRRPRRATPRRLSWVWLEGCCRCRGCEDANTDHSRPPLISRNEAEPETPLVAWWTRARSRLPCS